MFVFVSPAFVGDDVIGRAKTGSGKTAAFALPILEKLSKDPYGIFAIVLTPTRYGLRDCCSLRSVKLHPTCRELAFQIAEQFRAFGANMGLKDAVVTGGMGVSHLC